jgi:surfeit locus 1 family protein
MAQQLGTEPVLIVARSITPADASVVPWPVDAATIPNDHLQYAVTWFGLALVWAGMTLLFIRRNWRAKA